jgi:hypothetical protein
MRIDLSRGSRRKLHVEMPINPLHRADRVGDQIQVVDVTNRLRQSGVVANRHHVPGSVQPATTLERPQRLGIQFASERSAQHLGQSSL